MRHATDVQEELYFVFKGFSAHVAMERVLIPVKSHVNRIHDAVLEAHVAVTALEHLLPRLLWLLLRLLLLL